MTHPLTALTLNCLVLGQDSSHIFQVTPARSQSIADLKKGIRDEKKPAFDHVPADTLVLWKASVRIDDKLKGNLESLTFVKEESLSLPIQKLGDIFSPVCGHLHVVVRPPPPPALSTTPSAPTIFELNCWVLGDPSDHIFPVKIAANESVGSLKDGIKEKNQEGFQHVDAKSLVLWKVSVPDVHDPLEELSDLNFANKRSLSPLDKLSKVFSGVPKEGHLHIVVKLPTIEKMAATDGGAEERRGEIGALHNRFQSVIGRILKAPGPSDSAKSSAYTKSQIAYSIYDGRYKTGEPRPSVAPPIQLFHPAFGQFFDTISDTNIIPHDDMIRKTTDYMKAASAIYPDERTRTAELTPLLCDILDVDIQTIMNDDKTYADGTVEWVSEGRRILLLLKEDKNEFGDGGCDPSTQAGLSAARHWAQSKFERIRNCTSCPTFLIATAGPWIAVLGVVITDIVIVQRLTDFIWVGLDSVHNEPHITYVTRILFALRLGINHLGSYYKSLEPGGPMPLGSRYFPSITTYPNGDGFVNFKYVGYLENGLDCITLHARTCAEPTRDIVVKFVDRYGERAHRLLADVGLAPKLWYYGSPCLSEGQPSYHPLSMVVMEYIEGQTLATMRAKMDHKVTEGVQLEINRALGLLHDCGLVFGDLRSPNIMVKKTGEVKLIDFDWAGEQGQVKYPYLISRNIQWPEGVEALAIIKYNHDLEMFKQLFS